MMIRRWAFGIGRLEGEFWGFYLGRLGEFGDRMAFRASIHIAN
jgi:hypothetical protein